MFGTVKITGRNAQSFLHQADGRKELRIVDETIPVRVFSYDLYTIEVRPREIALPVKQLDEFASRISDAITQYHKKTNYEDMYSVTLEILY